MRFGDAGTAFTIAVLPGLALHRVATLLDQHVEGAGIPRFASTSEGED